MDDLGHRFINHPPRSEDVATVLDTVTHTMLGVLEMIDGLPEGREKSLALTKLEECSMWCKAAVARNQDAWGV